MSKTYQRIILVTDGTATSNVAEQSAINLAKEHGASLLAVDVIRPHSSISKWLTSKYDDHFNEFVVKKQDRLKEVAQRLRAAGVKIADELLFGKSSESIARKALTWKADLVVRYRKGKESQVVSGSGTTALTLMRICPCPLLLVGDESVPSQPKILACVDAEHQFEENVVILESAERIAGEKKNLLAAYCWHLDEDAFRHQFESDKLHPVKLTGQTELNLYLEEARKQYLKIYDRFVEQHDLASFPGGLKLENGEPNEAIPALCREEKVDVVVMSNAPHGNPLHKLLGSTVESVIEEVPCALLVTKPLGFESPIGVHAEDRQRASNYEGAKIRQKVISPKAHVSIFDDLPTAQRTIEALHIAGFALDKVELITKDADVRAHGIESPKHRERTGDSMLENAAKWGSVGAAAGGLSIVFAPFPGMVLGMMAVGGITGAIMGSAVGVEHAVEDDAVDLPSLEEYEALVRKGKCLVVVHGTHKEVMRAGSIINDLLHTRSHILTLHGHEFHEHPIRKATDAASNNDEAGRVV